MSATEHKLAAAVKHRALRDHAEDLIGAALASTNPEQRIEYAADALAAVAAAQQAQKEAA